MNNKKQNGQESTVTSEVLGAKAGYCAWSLRHQGGAPPRGWAAHLSHPSGPTHPTAPTQTLFKGPACSTSGSEQGHLLLVFPPSCCCSNSNKALPEFLTWPLINFYWLKSPTTQVGNKSIKNSKYPPPSLSNYQSIPFDSKCHFYHLLNLYIYLDVHLNNLLCSTLIKVVIFIKI